MTTGRASHRGLVVEDEWLLRMHMVDELHYAGWKTIEAATGEEALRHIAGEAPIDFLITDIRLPGAVDGWQVAEAFRARYAGRGVIYVSANPLVHGRLVEGGAFLSKPCDIETLLETCAKLCLGPAD
jgi:CheY-like chemotaxis protein